MTKANNGVSSRMELDYFEGITLSSCQVGIRCKSKDNYVPSLFLGPERSTSYLPEVSKGFLQSLGLQSLSFRCLWEENYAFLHLYPDTGKGSRKFRQKPDKTTNRLEGRNELVLSASRTIAPMGRFMEEHEEVPGSLHVQPLNRYIIILKRPLQPLSKELWDLHYAQMNSKEKELEALLEEEKEKKLQEEDLQSWLEEIDTIR